MRQNHSARLPHGSLLPPLPPPMTRREGSDRRLNGRNGGMRRLSAIKVLMMMSWSGGREGRLRGLGNDFLQFFFAIFCFDVNFFPVV
jgi:hypothetical protein